MTRLRWTAAKVEELKRLWRAGRSATEIGIALHLTRGQVSGKIDRLGLMGRGGAMRKDDAPSTPAPRIPF